MYMKQNSGVTMSGGTAFPFDRLPQTAGYRRRGKDGGKTSVRGAAKRRAKSLRRDAGYDSAGSSNGSRSPDRADRRPAAATPAARTRTPSTTTTTAAAGAVAATTRPATESPVAAPTAPKPAADSVAAKGRRGRPSTAMTYTPATPLQIRPFHSAELQGSQRVGIIGLPGMGKSTCVKSLLYELRYAYPVVTAVSGSEAENGFYGAMIPPLYVCNKLSKKFLKMSINRQRLAVAHDCALTDALLVLDDCFESPAELDNKMTRIMFKQGRHLRLAVWVVQQYIVDLKPYARSTTSAVVLFHCPSGRDRRLLYTNYGSMFPDYGSFDAVYTAICAHQPHTAMVLLLNRPGGGGLHECVFWYKPQLFGPDDPPIELCHPDVRRHAELRTDPDRLRGVELLTIESADGD
jgi:hypothetical protein